MERPRREKKAKVDVSALNALSNAKRGIVSRKDQHQVRVAIAFGGYAQRACARGQPVWFARAPPPGSPGAYLAATGGPHARTTQWSSGTGTGFGGRGWGTDERPRSTDGKERARP
jgi:hypothetical protein